MVVAVCSTQVVVGLRWMLSHSGSGLGSTVVFE